MHIKEKIWNLKTEDTACIQSLKEEMPEVPDHYISLFYHRNIQTKEEADDFVNPSLEQLHDPFEMRGMKEASERLIQAIKDGENILIFGDYDVDGTTSVAMLHNFIEDIALALRGDNYYKKEYNEESNSYQSKHLKYYVPNRFTEGYGLSDEGIQFAQDHGTSLMITVDCGIKDFDAVHKAESLGINVIVCDHHEPEDHVPKCVAVLNPKQNHCEYPFKELSGCGVVFKLAQGILKSLNLPAENIEKYLDYVTLSTIADVVSLTGENRILVANGLNKMNQVDQRSFFIQGFFYNGINREEALFKDLKQPIDVTEIGFKIAPLINAAGRMEHAKYAIEYFLAEDKKNQLEKLKILINFNNDRKNIDKNIFDEAVLNLEKDQDFNNKKSIVLYSKDWHIGTVGIVASRLVDKFYKPTIILTEIENGLYAGSGRSIFGLNLVETLNQQADRFTSFGGHYFAAGMRLREEDLEDFKEQFEKDVAVNLSKEDQIPILEIDCHLDINHLNSKFFNTIKRFEPCGQDNPMPLFASLNIEKRKIQGMQFIQNKHLKFTIGNYVALGFNLAEKYKALNLKDYDTIDIAYNVVENYFQNRQSFQLRIVDLKRSKTDLGNFGI